MFPSRPLRYWLILIATCSIVSFYHLIKSPHRSDSVLNYATHLSIGPAFSLPAADASLVETARQVTVRILTPSSSG